MKLRFRSVGGCLATGLVAGLLLHSAAWAVSYNATVASKSRVPAGSTNVAIRTFDLIPMLDIVSFSEDVWSSMTVTFDNSELVLGTGISSLALFKDADNDDSFSAAADTSVQTQTFSGGETAITFTGLSQTFTTTANGTTYFLVANFRSSASLGSGISLNISALASNLTNVPDLDEGKYNEQAIQITGIVLSVDATVNPLVTIPGKTKVTMVRLSASTVGEDFSSLQVQVANDAANFDSDKDSNGPSAVYIALDSGQGGLPDGVFESGTDNIVGSISTGNLSDASAVTVSINSPDDIVSQTTTLNYFVLFDIGAQTSIENSTNVQARVERVVASGGTSGISYSRDGNDADNAITYVGGIEYKNLESIVPAVDFGAPSAVPMVKFRLRAEQLGATIDTLTFQNQGDVQFITDPNDTDGITTVYLYRDDGDYEFDGSDRETLVTASVLGGGNQSDVMRISNLDLFVPTYNQDSVETNELGFFVVYDIGSGVSVSSPNPVAGFQISAGTGQSNQIADSLVLLGTLPSDPSVTVTIEDTSLSYSGVQDLAPVTINRGAVAVPMIGVDLAAESDLSGIVLVLQNDSGNFSSAGDGVSAVYLYRDLNSNNLADTADVLLSTTRNFTSGTQVSLPAFNLSQGSHHVVLAYDIGPNASISTTNIRAKISGLDSSSSSSVVLSGDLPIPRSGEISGAVAGLLEVLATSTNVGSINSNSDTFNLEVEVVNICESDVVINAISPKFYKTTIGGNDISSEYPVVATMSYPLVLGAGGSATYNFEVNPRSIRSSATVVADVALTYESTPTFDVIIQRYEGSSGYAGGATANATFTASSTFNAQTGDLPSYIASITVDGQNFRSGNYVNAGARMTITFSNSGQDINASSVQVFLNGIQLVQGTTAESGFTYDSGTGVLVIVSLGSSSGTVTLMANDNADNGLESLTMTFVIQSEFTLKSLLAFPNPYSPLLAGSTLRIGFLSSRAGSAEVYIYGATGHLVHTLSVSAMVVGYNEVTWSGIRTNDTTLPSGVYTLRLRATDTAGNILVARGKLAVY